MGAFYTYCCCQVCYINHQYCLTFYFQMVTINQAIKTLQFTDNLPGKLTNYNVAVKQQNSFTSKI